MTHLKVRAVDCDYVRWDVSPFLPGKMFWSPPKDRIDPLKIQGEKILVRVPSRLDPVVLDYARLQPTSEENDYKAGAVGFGASLYTRVEITLEGKEVKSDGNLPLVTEHIALLMKEVAGYEGGVHVSCKSHGYKHVGLSSTGSASAGVAYGLNNLWGNFLSPDTVVRLIAHNFAEESEIEKGYLTPGISTGNSAHIAYNGGITVVSSDCELVMWETIPEGTAILAGIPPLESAGKGPETSDVDVHPLSWIRHVDRFNAAKVCYWLLMDFMPAAKRGDLQKMGEILYDIMFCGSKAPLIPLHGGNLTEVILEQRMNEVEICFMSSAGPGLIAMTRENREVARDIFESHGYEIIEVKPDNRGLKILNTS